MAIVILSEKVKVKIDTYEEAAVLHGFLVERKYKGVRIGDVYLECSYGSEKEALSAGRKDYKITYDGFSYEEAPKPLPYPVAPITPVQQVEIMEPDGTIHKNHKEQSFEEWLESVSESRKLVIDVESVLDQLSYLELNIMHPGDFVALEWDDTIRTTCMKEVVVLKFNENSKNVSWKDRISGEWVAFRGNVTKDVYKWSDRCGDEFGYTDRWFASFYGYKMEVTFWGDNGFLDARVSLKKVEKSEPDDNWLDPAIEEAMILGGCWD
ncbi:MAG: hypothetical protein IJX63_10615 [Lachnospiraceae bacterium]|nr:hypothetical protein [Lachnospiraceae bacterium]